MKILNLHLYYLFQRKIGMTELFLVGLKKKKLPLMGMGKLDFFRFLRKLNTCRKLLSLVGLVKGRKKFPLM